MEEQIPKLMESGGAFALLAFVVWINSGILRLLIDNLTKANERLAQAVADLSSALRNQDQTRTEHQEQLLITKMLVQRVSEKLDG